MRKRLTARFITVLVLIFGTSAFAASPSSPIPLAQRPLFMGEVPPLNMLVMSRDHKLYYAAYNDASDLDGDGVIDIRYKPSIDYYGYFDSYKCYAWDTVNNEFYPTAATPNKQCTGQWSGDFLNYLTMSRMDLVRKALYGGYRSRDVANTGATANRNTVLERAYVPQDSHAWVKQYTSVAVDGYHISNYTPLPLPTVGTRHLFASVNLSGALNVVNPPLLRILTNRSEYAWTWASSERSECLRTPNTTNCPVGFADAPTFTLGSNEFYVRVRVCTSPSLLEANCKAYTVGSNTFYKPVGRLQVYGESNAMMFGLIAGSYDTNVSGGRLRKGMSSIANEINANGTFNGAVNGIISTLNKLRVLNFRSTYPNYQDCGLNANSSAVTNSLSPAADGGCSNWGNPVGEMMYEALRYFGGATAPTVAFTGATTNDNLLGLPLASWPTTATPLYTANPGLANTTAPPYPRCAKPFMMVLSDIYPSYDSDQVPGSYFGASITNDVLSLNTAAQADLIWTEEGLGTQQILIGQSGATYDGAPTVKTATGFSTIRGLVPEEPTRQGSYSAAAVAYYGRANDVNSGVAGDQKVTTITVPFLSPVPEIRIPVGSNTIVLVPFAKSVHWPSQSSGNANFINRLNGATQPTNSFAGLWVEQLTPTYGRFRVNFEDQEKGNDFDMDAVVTYEYQVNPGNTVTITVTSNSAAGSIIQHLGYVISGTTQDGLYLVVRDTDTGSAADVDSVLDTPPGQPPGGVWSDGVALPLSNTRTFTPSGVPSATILKDPLWYAAKYGGFFEDPNLAPPNDKPDLQSEWDSTGSGNPDAYVLVSRPHQFEQQLDRAFYEIFKRIGSASSVSNSSTSSQSAVTLYQGRFQVAGTDWSGQLLAYPFNPLTGQLSAPDWDAADGLQTVPNYSSRVVWTRNTATNAPVEFNYSALAPAQQAALDTNPVTGTPDGRGPERVAYLRGNAGNEGIGVNNFRRRVVTKLGDIYGSTPYYVGDLVAAGTVRDPVVYVGANDGMLHAFSAKTAANGGGTELFAYIPTPVIPNLNKLTDKVYGHQFYVDGSPMVRDLNDGGTWKTILAGALSGGGAGVYVLDVTDPSKFSNPALAASVPLWEFTDADDPDLGYSYGKPIIAKLSTGEWAVIFNNGYNSTTGNSVLFIAKLNNGGAGWSLGSNYYKLTVSGSTGGLSAPVGMDIENDGVIDYLYAGDLNGKLWRFDLRNPNPANWSSATVQIFQATDSGGTPQPIFGRPEVTIHPSDYSQILVYFGTGRYLTTGDIGNTSTQSFYAVWDKLAAAPNVITRSQLLQQEIVGTTTATRTTGPGGTTVTYTQTPRPGTSAVTGQPFANLMPANPGTINSSTPTNPTTITTTIEYRATSAHLIDWQTHLGWFMDFDYPANTGERVVADPILASGLVVFNTLQPSTDACADAGLSYLMALTFNSGAQDPRRVFDTSGDLQFGAEDVAAGGLRTEAMVGGLTVVFPQTATQQGYPGTGAGYGGIGVGSSGAGTPPSAPPGCVWVAGSGASGTMVLQCINPGSGTGRITWRELIAQ